MPRSACTHKHSSEQNTPSLFHSGILVQALLEYKFHLHEIRKAHTATVKKSPIPAVRSRAVTCLFQHAPLQHDFPTEAD